MISLLIILSFVVLIYFVQKNSPFIAGLIAVIPVKIFAASIFSYKEGGITSTIEAIKGMMGGQIVILCLLIAVYFYLTTIN